jgi:hypothetical protein
MQGVDAVSPDANPAARRRARAVPGRTLGLGLAVLLWLASPQPAPAQGGADEAAVKFAFLLNFSKFVEWPGKGQVAPVVLCILGHPDVLANGKILSEKAPAGQKMVAKDAGEDPEFRTCHVLFIGEGRREGIHAILEKTKERPVLTVSDAEDFTAEGGMIGLVNREDRLKFEINLSAAQRAGLKLSSKLVQLAISVQ